MATAKTPRRALVTGATRGIGKATAVALANAGWDVAFTGRTRRAGEGRDDSDTGEGRPLPGSLDETGALVRHAGGRALALVADLHDRAALDKAVGEVTEQWGGIDLLVNNAVDTGPGSMVPILELTADQVDTKLDANVVAPFVLVRAVLPGMLERGSGVIVGVTSHVATADPPGPVGRGGWGLAYAASKAAFHRIAPLVAVELGGQGIRAFNLDPGYVENGATAGERRRARPGRALHRCPAERAGHRHRLDGRPRRRAGERGDGAGPEARPRARAPSRLASGP